MTDSIVDILNDHSKNAKNKSAFIFINENGEEIDQLSYSQLRSNAENIASFLQKTCSPGDRVLLLFQPGLDYIRALFGCFIAGAIAVPLYPPRKNKKAERILRVSKSCEYSLILCGEQDKETIMENFNTEAEGVVSAESIKLHTIESVIQTPSDGKFFPICSDNIAFLQYTSGSTGMPKGVIITHENIIGNVSALVDRGNPCSNNDIFVNWLPLFHDLGLVTAVLWPVYLGATSVLISPAHFVRDPALWLQTITKYRGTICGAPNFAYQLCRERIPDESLSSLDLSSWRIAYNAAEPVQPDTIVGFNDKFSATGLSPSALLASYGMAESTAFISSSDVDKEITIFCLDADLLARNEIVPCDPNTKRVQSFVGCGKTSMPHDIRIVDPDTGHEQSDQCIGEIWFSGPSVSKGYWGLPELSKDTFGCSLEGRENQYMRTGDLGFTHQGEVFVTGRMKDLIIVEGKNYYPQDIEWHIERNHQELAAGSCAAFSLPDNNSEKLVVVAELVRSALRDVDLSQLVKILRRKIASEFYIYPKLVVLVKPLSMPKTSSGKIQRKLTRELLINDQLNIIFRSDNAPKVDYIPPSSDCEKKLCSLAGRILEKDRVGVADNFLDLGGKSLTAMEFIAAIKESFNGIEISFEQLFSTPSIGELAIHIEKRTKLEDLHRSAVKKSNLQEEFEI